MAFLLVSSWLPASKHRDEIDGRIQIRWGLDGEVSKGGRGIGVGMDGDRRAFWRPCSSRRSSPSPSWTSSHCHRPWLKLQAPPAPAWCPCCSCERREKSRVAGGKGRKEHLGLGCFLVLLFYLKCSSDLRALKKFTMTSMIGCPLR